MFDWLFGYPSAPTAMQNVIQKQKPPCPHDDWHIYGNEPCNRPPSATCTKCLEVLPLDDLLNNWKARIERELGVKK